MRYLPERHREETMSLSKYTTLTLYKSALHKQNTSPQKRRELAQFKRDKRLGLKLARMVQG